jgi:hypothetical protein
MREALEARQAAVEHFEVCPLYFKAWCIECNRLETTERAKRKAALAACPPDEPAAPEPAQPLIEMACPDCGRTISTTDQAGEIWHGCTYCVTSWPCQHRAAHAPAAKER